MITSVQAAAPVPAYCTSGKGVLTPAEYSYCVHLGWNQSYGTPVSADLAGHGSGLGTVLIVLLIVVALFVLARRSGRSRTPVTSK